MALKKGVRGLGMWYADSLAYPLHKNPESKGYWDMMAHYAKRMSLSVENDTL